MNASPAPQATSHAQEVREEAAAENLRFAMADHQEMIRGADLKAEVLGIFITAVFAAVAFEGHISMRTVGGWLGIVATLGALAAFFCVGGVIWPRSDPRHAVPLGGYTPSRVLYPPEQAGPEHTVSEHAKRALHTDWPSELTYELWKVSLIRSAKQKWFRAALIASGASVLAEAVRQFVQ